MRVINLPKVLSCLLLIASVAGKADAATDRAEDASVHIECGYRNTQSGDLIPKSERPRSYGSGAIISDNEQFFVVTAMHVTTLEPSGSPEIEQYCRAGLEAPLAGNWWWLLDPRLPIPQYEEDAKGDLKIPVGVPDVQIWTLNGKPAVEPISVCDANDSIQKGDEIHALGFRAVIKGGVISFDSQSDYARQGIFQDKKGLQGAWRTDLKFSKGESGGPVTDKDGNLIGVIRGRRSNDESSFTPTRRFSQDLYRLDVKISKCGKIYLPSPPKNVDQEISVAVTKHGNYTAKARMKIDKSCKVSVIANWEASYPPNVDRVSDTWGGRLSCNQLTITRSPSGQSCTASLEKNGYFFSCALGVHETHMYFSPTIKKCGC